MASSNAPPAAAPPPFDRAILVKLFLVGFAAGLINGLLSIGGGILIVPGLIFLRGAPPRAAVPTSLATVLLMSVAAMAAHVRVSGFTMSPLGTALLVVAGMAAAQAGGLLLSRAPVRVLYFAFATLALLSSAQLIAVALGAVPPLTRGEPPLWCYPLIGAFSGFLSGLLGIGGGGLVVLAFSVAFHTPVLGGLPVALAVNITNSISGIFAQGNQRFIAWRDVAWMLPPAGVGVAIGVAGAVALEPNALRIVFALFFVFIGTSMARRGVLASRPPFTPDLG